MISKTLSDLKQVQDAKNYVESGPIMQAWPASRFASVGCAGALLVPVGRPLFGLDL